MRTDMGGSIQYSVLSTQKAVISNPVNKSTAAGDALSTEALSTSPLEVARREQHLVNGRFDRAQIARAIAPPELVELRQVVRRQIIGARGGIGIVWQLERDHHRLRAVRVAEPVAAPLP